MGPEKCGKTLGSTRIGDFGAQQVHTAVGIGEGEEQPLISAAVIQLKDQLMMPGLMDLADKTVLQRDFAQYLIDLSPV
jgi:hypothetical protein